ncbi:HNH/ENDO VII family nuclease [Cellulomonas sp. Root137]|uniref:HNH/ENDO VII family nuclease n=1 Tax=Cellulomonas sp. Root137 TaxID=1736459 RepID=UPI003516F7DC
MPDQGVPGSFGYDEQGALLTYANSRPDYAPGQVEAVWDAAPKLVDESGDTYVQVVDANDDLVRVYWEPGQPRDELWDMGHVTGEEYHSLRRRYLEHEITQEQFLAEFRDPDNYQVAHPGRNRSHVDEA